MSRESPPPNEQTDATGESATELLGVETTLYRCRTCEVRFTVPDEESVVCCPVCRMNRIVSAEP